MKSPALALSQRFDGWIRAADRHHGLSGLIQGQDLGTVILTPYGLLLPEISSFLYELSPSRTLASLELLVTIYCLESKGRPLSN